MGREGEILQGTYRIIEQIGKGGAGKVYLAEHLHLQKKVVVKKLHHQAASSLRVRQEVDILKGLHHDRLPQVYDFLQLGQEIYTVMEYIQGQDLQKYLDQGYVFPEPLLRKWLEQLCEVLEYLHGQTPPILHCDIKPGNIMITPQENVCLIDFNISLEEKDQGAISGLSLQYCAPEQYALACYGSTGGGPLDERMDIYSLGASFYTLMTGLIPGVNPDALCPLSRLDLPYSSGLRAIVEKAMETERKKRYASAGQMKKALERIRRLDRESRKYQKKVLGLLGGCGVFLTAGILCCYYGAGKEARETYREKYEVFYQLCQKEAYEEIPAEGRELLNDAGCRRILEKNPQEKGALLQKIGESYFYLEEYSQAAEYYEEALKFCPEEADYYRDYAVALARMEEFSQAAQVAEEAAKNHISSEDLLLTQGEVQMEMGAYEEAVSYAEAVLERSSDRENCQRACILAAEAYEKLGDRKGQIRMLTEAAAYKKDREVLRKQAAAYMALAQEEQEEKAWWIGQARACYEELEAMGSSRYEDVLNRAIVEWADHKFLKSRDLLLEISEKGIEDYRIYMYLALALYEIEENKAQGQREYGQVQEAYQRAKGFYDSKTEDPMMEQLERAVETVE